MKDDLCKSMQGLKIIGYDASRAYDVVLEKLMMESLGENIYHKFKSLIS